MGISVPSHLKIMVEESGKALLYRKSNKSFYYNLHHDLELIGIFKDLDELIDKVSDVRYQKL